MIEDRFESFGGEVPNVAGGNVIIHKTIMVTLWVNGKPLRPIVLLRHLFNVSNLVFNCLIIGSFISDLNARDGARDHMPKHSLETTNYKWVTNFIFIQKTIMVTLWVNGKQLILELNFHLHKRFHLSQTL